MTKPETVEQFNDETLRTVELRNRVQAIHETENLSWKDMAIESGIKHGTLTNWKGDTYAGSIPNVNAKVELWLTSRAEKKHRVMSVLASPAYVETPTSQEFYAIIQMAQTMPDMTSIVGGPGIGKTITAKNYQARNPNVIMVTASPMVAGANAILNAIAEDIGMAPTNAAKLFKTVATSLHEGETLIIVDEAQNLNMDALEQLRTLHDMYRIGLVFMGNEMIHSLLTSGRKEGEHAQLFSRLGPRIKQRSARKDDIEMLIGAWGVGSEDVRRQLRVIASRPGALRVMDKALKMSHMIASSDGRSDLKTTDVIQAYSQLNSSGAKL